MLQKTNFCTEMDEASGGTVGLQYFEDLLTSKNRVVPNLILLDINMPVMNGWEFLELYSERYLKHFPECKVIILTSSVNPEDRVMAENHANVVDFMPKPISLDGLETLKGIPELQHFFMGEIN